jgi:oligopeptide/dipeptide ABC transporter ATP-binding protein
VKAVDDVSLAIGQKESVGLVGESGCGKTMTAFSIMRLVKNPGKIIGGQILFKDKDLLQLTPEEMSSIRGSQISMIFQDPLTYLNPVMKIGNQISEVILRHQGGNKKDAEKRAIEILNLVGMPSPSRIKEFYSFQLSGGMRQRTLIGMALACNPSLLIADEPTTALDVTVQAQILDVLRNTKEHLGNSLLLITHDFGIVAEICDRIYVMYAARIIEHADVYTLYENPKHPYTTGLLNIASSFEEFRTPVAIEGSVPDLTDPPSGCRFHPRCSQAKEICREREPPTVAVEPGHTVSCWLYE